MPAAIVAYAVTSAATYVGASAIVASALGAVASYAISSSMASREQRKAEDAAKASYNSSLRDITMVFDNPVVPRNIILGKTRTSGPVWPWFTYGDQGQYHIFGLFLAGHECEDIETVYFNEDALTLDFAGNVTGPAKYTNTTQQDGNETFVGGAAGLGLIVTQTPGGTVLLIKQSTTALPDGTLPPPVVVTNFTQVGRNLTVNDDTTGYLLTATYNWLRILPLFSIKKHLGAPGQVASPELIYGAAQSGNPAAWDANRKAEGLCYITVTMNADFNVLGDIGVPKVSAIVKGVKAYDPRTGLTAWTDNPTILARWFLLDCPYSPATAASEVNDAVVTASANVCDESIDFSATRNEKRYTCNGNLSCEEVPLANLNHILDAMDGDALYAAGQWQLQAGYYRTPTLTLDESTLSDDSISLAPYAQKSDLFNLVNGTFINPAASYQVTSYESVTSPVYQADDYDEVLPQDMSFVTVNDPIRCQMIAWQRLSRARNSQTLQLGTNMKGYDTLPLQNVTVQLKNLLGPDPKVFTVRNRTFNAPRLTYSLQETSPAVWAWDYTQATAAVDIPNTSFPDIITVPVLAGLVITSGSDNLVRQPDGSVTSRIRVTWDQVDNIYVQNGGTIRWQYRKVTDTAWQSAAPVPGSSSQIYLDPVEDGEIYALRGQCVSSSGREGNFTATFLETVVGKTEDPTPPSAVAATPDAVIFALSPDYDVAGYEVRYNQGTNKNGSVATPLHTGLVPGSPWPMPIRLYGINTVLVRAVDTGGRVSAWVSDTQNFGVPDAANIAHFIDYAASGFPGVITDGTVVGSDLQANVDPATDFYGDGSGADIYYRDGAPDIYGGGQYLALVYVAQYASPYAGGAIFLDLVATGPRITVEYRVDGSAIGDIYSDMDGDGDIYAGSVGIYGDAQNWQPWPGVLTPTVAGLGLQFRVTVDAGSVRGVIDAFAVRTEMPTISQTFKNVVINSAGTTLLPANGLPALTFISIESVQVTPVADGSGAISGRVKGAAVPAGIPIELINSAAATVTGHAYVDVSGF